MDALRIELAQGAPAPLGATWDGSGVNFALYSQHAERVELLLYGSVDRRAPSQTVELQQRSGPIWHAYLAGPGIGPSLAYGYRVHGPHRPERGHRFNPHKVLLDPYAKALARPLRWDDALFGYPVGGDDRALCTQDSAAVAPLAAVVDQRFDWLDDRNPRVPWCDTVIYETHVKGISMRHPEVDPALRGSYLGLASEPIIEHLVGLGVTAVELLPVQAFLQDHDLTQRGLSNYWGYNPLAYFAPEPRYATNGPLRALDEFKEMVRRLHAAGLEVLLDVVYNHTGEGNQLGPTISLRGIDNALYYKLSPADPRYYMNYTGTGNTLDLRRPAVLQLVMDSLRYWVQEFHVDGFRFDLAVSLGRDNDQAHPKGTLFQAAAQDPVLSQVKLIAEPWDLGPGGYQLGQFPWPWSEWNGRYRDVVRRFFLGARESKGDLATALAGSTDLFKAPRELAASITFVTAHDGFTLEDLVSYKQKHNAKNGEANRDGHDHNLSDNCGHEGPSECDDVLRCRERRKRALLCTLLLSQGVPMVLGGDELSRSQGGNNNAYCQDNETSWFDWKLDERKEAFLHFVRALIAFRRAHPSLRRRRALSGARLACGCKELSWWHPSGREMKKSDWADGALPSLGMLLCSDPAPRSADNETLLVLFSCSHQPEPFKLPQPHGLDSPARWQRKWSSEDAFFGSATDPVVSIPPWSVEVYRCAGCTSMSEDASSSAASRRALRR